KSSIRYWLHSPVPGARNVGTPLSAEMPAPVSTITDLAPRSRPTASSGSANGPSATTIVSLRHLLLMSPLASPPCSFPPPKMPYPHNAPSCGFHDSHTRIARHEVLVRQCLVSWCHGVMVSLTT